MEAEVAEAVGPDGVEVEVAAADDDDCCLAAPPTPQFHGVLP